MSWSEVKKINNNFTAMPLDVMLECQYAALTNEDFSTSTLMFLTTHNQLGSVHEIVRTKSSEIIWDKVYNSASGLGKYLSDVFGVNTPNIRSIETRNELLDDPETIYYLTANPSFSTLLGYNTEAFQDFVSSHTYGTYGMFSGHDSFKNLITYTPYKSQNWSDFYYDNENASALSKLATPYFYTEDNAEQEVLTPVNATSRIIIAIGGGGGGIKSDPSPMPAGGAYGGGGIFFSSPRNNDKVVVGRGGTASTTTADSAGLYSGIPGLKTNGREILFSFVCGNGGSISGGSYGGGAGISPVGIASGGGGAGSSQGGVAGAGGSGCDYKGVLTKNGATNSGSAQVLATGPYGVYRKGSSHYMSGIDGGGNGSSYGASQYSGRNGGGGGGGWGAGGAGGGNYRRTTGSGGYGASGNGTAGGDTSTNSNTGGGAGGDGGHGIVVVYHGIPYSDIVA